jgi:hypothetical protein
VEVAKEFRSNQKLFSPLPTKGTACFLGDRDANGPALAYIYSRDNEDEARQAKVRDWYWRLHIRNDDGLIGPFSSRDEAAKDAKETLGISEGDVDR